jgi:Domain of Unknown Function (DUF928)
MIYYQKKWLYLVTLSFLISSAIPIQVEAQSKVRYIPPTNVGTPRKTVGGVTRSDKCADTSCLIALIPGTSKTGLVHYPLTVLERPTFYFNLPQIKGRAYFKLYKEGEDSVSRAKVYSTTFDIATESGVIGFDLPEDAPALIIDQGYQWVFTISSNGNMLEPVNGYVKRIALSADLSTQLNVAPPLECATKYAKAGIWLDALRTLAKLRLTQPQNQNLVQEWQELLESVQLVKISQQPLLGYYDMRK